MRLLPVSIYSNNVCCSIFLLGNILIDETVYDITNTPDITRTTGITTSIEPTSDSKLNMAVWSY